MNMLIGARKGMGRACAPLLRRIFIASTATYDYLLPHGSHVALDPLWSTEQIDIVHDGCEATRWQKLERIMHDPVVQNHLRVCWRRPHGEFNCCRCSTCLRVMVYLAALGVLDKFPTFDHPIDVEAVKTFGNLTVWGKWYTQTLLDAVDRIGSQPVLAQALRDNLSRTITVAQPPPAEPPDESARQQPGASKPDERIHALEARVAYLESVIYRLQASRSWQFTTPLRSLAAIARRRTKGSNQ